MTDIRVTREAVEVATNLTTTPSVYVTRQAIEVLTSTATTEPPASLARRMITTVYVHG